MPSPDSTSTVVSTMYIQFARFSPPRHPVLRLLLGLAGLTLLALFSVVGLFIAAGVALVVAARVLWLRWRFRDGIPQPDVHGPRQGSAESSRVRDDDIIDGEFTVIDHNRRPNR